MTTIVVTEHGLELIYHLLDFNEVLRVLIHHKRRRLLDLTLGAHT